MMRKRSLRARRGVAAVLVAVMALPLIIALGMAVDYVRMLTVRGELQRASDAASIAAARIMKTAPPNDAQITTDARMYFWANYRPNLLDSVIVGGQPSVTVNFERTRVTLSSTAEMPLVFGSFLGFSTATMSLTSTAEKYTRTMELVLALDNTASMNGGSPPGLRIANMKSGANQLLDIVFNNLDQRKVITACPAAGGPNWTRAFAWGAAAPDCYEHLVTASIVPFVATVNIHPRNTSAALNLFTPADAGGFGVAANTWKGCVEAMPGGEQDATAENLPSGQLRKYRWKPTPQTFTYGGNGFLGPNYWITSGPLATVETSWHNAFGAANAAWNKSSFGAGAGTGIGPNRGCGNPSIPLQISRNHAKALVNLLAPGFGNGTALNLGFSWGWRMLTPNYRAIWGWPSGGWYDWHSFYDYKAWDSVCSNGTAVCTGSGALGYADGRYVLVPRGVPRAYGTQTEKVLVLFTDGIGNEMGACPSGVTGGVPPDGAPECFFYSGAGDWLSNPYGVDPQTTLNDRTLTLCAAIKAAGGGPGLGGPKIFVILLLEPSAVNYAAKLATSVALLRGPGGCSSDSDDTISGVDGGKYFLHAPDAASIVQAFKDVGAVLSAIRLVQ